MSFTLHKLTAHIGARVVGLDPREPLDTETTVALRRALAEHKALVLDAPGLDTAGQERFVSAFGPVTTAHPTVPGVDGSPNVLDVDSSTSKANEWHTDVTFVVNPPAVTSLRSITIPSYGGETLIASTAAAYRSLPDPLRAWADRLWAVHTNVYDYARAGQEGEGHRKYREAFESTLFETAHPVVRVHPESGERGLFLGGFVKRIEGLSATESKDVVRLLQAHVTKPEHILRWSWQPEQLLLFDNRITQHYAIDNYDDQPRKLARITVAGDVPVSVAGERSRSLAGNADHYTVVAA